MTLAQLFSGTTVPPSTGADDLDNILDAAGSLGQRAMTGDVLAVETFRAWVNDNWRGIVPEPVVTSGVAVTASVTLHHSLPADLVVVTAETKAKIQAAANVANGFVAVEITEANVNTADVAWRDVQGMLRAVEAERTRLKEPVLDLGRQLDAAAREAVAPLEAAKRALGDKLGLFSQQQKKKAEEAAREVQRIANEAAQKARAEQERQRAEAAKNNRPPPPPVLPPRPVPAVKLPPPVVSKAVTMKKRKEIVVTDKSKIPFEVGGVCLWDLNEAAVKKLLEAGVKIEGVSLEEFDTAAGRA